MHIKDNDLSSALSEQLGDEKVLAAAYARVTTALGAARMLSPLGNYLIARPAARSAARKITESTDLPLDAAVVFGVTDQALHVWRADPMLNQVHDHIGQVPLSQVLDITVEAGRSWQPMRITLSGGEVVELQARGAAHVIATVVKDQRGT
jgi:hypothetical protein